MSAVVCETCAGYIETGNRRHPGFCSQGCRDVEVARRDAVASDLAQRRADARQQHQYVTRRRWASQ